MNYLVEVRDDELKLLQNLLFLERESISSSAYKDRIDKLLQNLERPWSRKGVS